MVRLNWKSIRLAATAGLIVIVPATIVSQTLLKDSAANGPSSWAWLFFLVTLVGFVIAGFGAGRLEGGTPMAHGAAAAATAWLVVQGLGTIRRLVAGESISWASLPLWALIATTCGIGGALIGDWFRRQHLDLGDASATTEP